MNGLLDSILETVSKEVYNPTNERLYLLNFEDLYDVPYLPVHRSTNRD